MKRFAKNSQRLAWHVLAMLCVSVMVTLFVFYYYLPRTTRHGESITMPQLEGMHVWEVDALLREKKLAYRVLPDSEYNQHSRPLTVHRQFPPANSKVKENREVQLILNTATPPTVRMPKLVDGSLKNAIFLLDVHHLTLGNVRYVPDLAENAVLQQCHRGQHIAPQTYVASGSVIDLVVGRSSRKKREQNPRKTTKPSQKDAD